MIAVYLACALLLSAATAFAYSVCARLAKLESPATLSADAALHERVGQLRAANARLQLRVERLEREAGIVADNPHAAPVLPDESESDTWRRR